MKSRTTNLTLIFFPVLLTLLIMTPRLISPNFGMLDDGTMFVRAKEVLSGNFSNSFDIGAGRFKPASYIINAINFFFFRYSPLWYFIGMSLMFLTINFCLVFILQKARVSPLCIIISLIFFAFNGTIIESFYTLSKHETYQLMWVVISILFLVLGYFSKTKQENKIFTILAGIFIFIAFYTKETTFAMVAIIGGFWLYTIKLKSLIPIEFRKMLLNYLMIIIMGGFLYLITLSLSSTVSISSGTYSQNYSLELKNLLSNVLRWTHLLIHYFPYLFPAMIGFLILLTGNRKPKIGSILIGMVFAAIWSTFWFGIYLPWSFSEAYYLLPFSFGVSIFTGLYIYGIFSKKVPANFMQRALALLSCLLFLLTIPNLITNGKIQIAMDKVNQEMLKYVSKSLDQNGRVLVNIQESNEYLQGIHYFLADYYERDDIATSPYVTGYDAGKESQVFVLVPLVTNQPILTPRMNIIEDSQKEWNETLHNDLKDVKYEKAVFIEEFRLFNINLTNLLCPILGERNYCNFHEPVFDTRIFSYQWEIIKMK